MNDFVGDVFGHRRLFSFTQLDILAHQFCIQWIHALLYGLLAVSVHIGNVLGQPLVVALIRLILFSDKTRVQQNPPPTL